MDVDVDGAPNAYGPKGKKALDILAHAHAPTESGHPEKIVGFMTEYEVRPADGAAGGRPVSGVLRLAD